MRAWFGLIFAASGAAALVYEVTWTRLLTLQFGHGVAAASTVLAAFMGGLAVGAAIGGRIGNRLTRGQALRVYAGLESAIALLALALPFVLDALTPLLVVTYADGEGGVTFSLVRVVSTLIILSIPATAMGATFPVAARWFVQASRGAARDAGLLYAANTVGAASGALVAGFVLLPALGLSGTTGVGMALNLVAAAGAWMVASAPVADERVEPRPAGPGRKAKAATPTRRGSHVPAIRAPRLAVAAAGLGVSGLASLTLQVVWTRILALVLGPTTYAFSIVVAVFVAGLAAGAGLAAPIAARSRQPVAWLAGCLSVAAGLSLVAAGQLDAALMAIAQVVRAADVTFSQVLSQQAAVSIALLAPMTIAFGAAFPLAVAVGARDDHVAADLGTIYAVNTSGAILGALASGFLLLGWLGLQGTLRAVAILSALAAVGLLAAGRVTGRARLTAGSLAMACLALAVFGPSWNLLLLSSGAYKYAGALQGPDLKTALSAGTMIYYGEGPAGTVAVRKVAGTTSLSIDGKVDASDAGDMLTQRLLAHVPLLLHPDPQRVAVVGLGSGVTLGSALRHPITQADVLEISAEVVEASRAFDEVNHRALDDRRTRVITGDGRTHLLLTRQSYDVIISEPSNPWMAGIASLFTREFFEAAKARLGPDGVLCQWAHTYDISTEDLQSIVATFLSVFPEGTLWLVGDGDILLVGSHGPLTARLDSVPGAWDRPGVREDLASVGVLEPFHILSMYIGSGQPAAGWAAGAPLQTDDLAGLEFSGPRSVFSRAAADNASLLRSLAAGPGARPPAIERAFSEATPDSFRDRGWMLLAAEAVRPAYADFARAVEANPDDVRAFEGLVRASAQAQKGSDTRTLLLRLAAGPGRAAAKIALSRFVASEGDFDQAARVALTVLESDPGHVAALEQLASVLSDRGDLERMRPVVARLRLEAPNAPETQYYTAALLFMENRLDLALTEARRLVDANPGHGRAQNLLGACLGSLGRRDEARGAFLASIAANPRDPSTYVNLATLELQAGDLTRAAQYFAEALSVDPSSPAARDGLARVSRN
ncbi:MAG: fused MFS/spermidine synthase [Acidobacteriota bacterium]